MKLTVIIIQIAILVTINGSPTSKHKKSSKENVHKEKPIDQEAQPGEIREKRGSHKHYVHLLKPVNKLKSFHVVHGNYHEHHVEKPKHHKEEEVHHTVSETHEHIHHDDEKDGKVEEYHSDESHEPVSVETQHYYEEHKEKVKVKHHHHHHHHNHVKTVIKKVPEPYPVEKVVHVPVEKIVHVPVEKVVHVPKPFPVEKLVEKVVHVPVEKIVHVPKPYPVETIVEKPIEVEKKVPVEVKVPYPVEKVVHVPVEKIVEKVVHVPKPYPVEKIVEKIVQVPKPYPIIKHVPYPVEVKVPVHIPKPVPYPVEKKVPVPIEVEKKVPVPFKVEVEKKVPIFVPQPHPYYKFERPSGSYSPVSFDSFEKDYSSSDSKVHQVRVPKNTSRDQIANPSIPYTKLLPPKEQNLPKLKFVTPSTQILAQQQQLQQKLLQEAQIRNAQNAAFNQQVQSSESNVQPVAVAPFGSQPSKFQITVPDNTISQEQILSQSSDLIAQVHPLQTFPIQLVQLEPIHFQPPSVSLS